MSCLILRSYLKVTYRGLIDLLAGHGALRRVLGMEEKLPHYTTLQKFSARKDVLAVADAMIAQIGSAALRVAGKKPAIAIDSTGMETTTASAHFTSRAGRQRRKWVRLSMAVVCGSLFPLGLVLDWGPGNDKCQAFELIQKSFDAADPNLPEKMYADAGYDADWIHGVCREVWGVQSIIKPARACADGSLGGVYRPEMTKQALEKNDYGKRWHIESFFSGLKRMTVSALTARKDINLAKEAAFRVLAYTIHR
jgi:transposase